jgi:Stage II sporulation protein E (SpoIIE)/Nitrate and nitrite sensing
LRERFASTAIATALAGLIVLGVLSVLVLSIVGSRRALSEADMTVAVAEVTSKAIDTTADLQRERGLGAVVATQAFSSLRSDYEQAITETDDAMTALRVSWSRYREGIPDTASPPISDVLAAAVSLEEFRDATLGPSTESTYQLYTELVEKSNAATAELVKQSTDPVTLTDRALIGVLLGLTEAMHTQRFLVQQALSNDPGPTDELLLQLDVVSNDVRQGFFEARSLAGGATLETIEDLRAGQDSLAINTILDDLTTVDGDRPPISPEDWYELSSRRVDEVSALIPAIQAGVASDASDDLARASSNLWTRGILLGSLFVVSVLVAISVVQANRERGEALYEYGQLADGLREWFVAASFPDIPNLDVAARYIPASVRTMSGGDWYDVYMVGDSVAIAMGDVVGHGSRATAQMAQVRNLLRGQSLARPLAPAAQMDLLSSTLADSEIMATLTYGLLDPKVGEFVYTRAGHIPLLIRDADGRVRIEEEGTGPPVGGGRIDLERKEQTTLLAPGDTLLLMTDGVVEGIDRDIDAALGMIAAAIEGSGQSLEATLDQVFTLNPDDPIDDAAALLIRWKAGAQQV